MNYIVITIDALSKCYIDAVKTNGSFWEQLEEECISFENMFSVGPFTEAAVRGMWTGANPLDGNSYLSETNWPKETIFESFSNEGYYMYFGELVPYYNYSMKADNIQKREKCEERGFEHLWNNRLLYFINLYDKKLLEDNDLWKIEFLLDDFFIKFGQSVIVRKQACMYRKDKKEYIYDILKNGEKSILFSGLNNNLLDNCRYSNFYCIRNQEKHKLTSQEALVIKKIKNLNIQRFYELNDHAISITNEIIHSGSNRCIISNNDILAHMRDEAEVLPKLNEELAHFIKWYDIEGNKLDRPFFAYIHNYDFHYPENFMKYRCSNKRLYDKEVRDLNDRLNSLPCVPMSISKQLSIYKIEDDLKNFFYELEERKVFDSSRVIITADHGIANYMFSKNLGITRWNYTGTNFKVPLFIKGAGIDNNKVYSLVDNTFFPELLKAQSLNDECKKFSGNIDRKLFTFWVNGIPDLDRSDIKFGVRNEKYSITFQGMFTQLFQSLKILGIYDLQKDPDENNPLDSSYIYSIDQDFLCFAKEQWNHFVISVISNSNENYHYLKKYAYIIDYPKKYFDMNTCYKMKSDVFEQSVYEKKIIVFGRGKRLKLFLQHYAEKCHVIEIWDNKSDSKYCFGHKLCKPHKTTKEYMVIVCSRYEIEIIHQLLGLGINNYILFDSVMNESLG